MGKHRSVADMFRTRVKTTPDLDAFKIPTDPGWATLSWKEVGERVRAVACGLRALGLEDEQRAGVLCGTRYEWLIADIAINCAGGATTTIYPSSTADDCQFILSDSDSVVCFAEDEDQVKKLGTVRSQIPKVKHLIVIDGKASADGWVLSLSDLEEKGKAWDKANPGQYDATIDRTNPQQLATLIYTSGTTGRPKGVELIHDCWLYVGEAIRETGILSEKDVQYLWLPLAHSFGKMLEVLVIDIGIPTAVDGRIPKIVENLGEIRPTFMAAAPRIFEKVYNKVISGAKDAGGLKWKIFRWATGLGRQVSKLRQEGKQPSGMLAFKFGIADKLVFSKLRNKFGGRVRFFISGSAPLNRDIAEFFHAADLLILEGYGLTESSAASFVNRPDINRFGTVGPPLPGTEIRIAEDGEILFRSRGVMRGYHNLPEVTADTLEDGWLHTGDIGEVDPNGGHLRITDRKKDLIKTSGGKYVAPQSLEGQFKAICPYVGQVVVHGNNRNFCTALVTADEEAISAWAKQQGVNGGYKEIVANPKVKELFKGYFDQLNAKLARYETIKDFAILPVDFTVEGGELTPSLKVKRKVVETRYKDLLDKFYAGSIADV